MRGSLNRAGHGLGVSQNWSRYLAIYADRSIIVLNKPPHLVCQPSQSILLTCSTVGLSPASSNGVSSLTSFFQDLKARFQLREAPYTVHRLDKSTTGLLVLGKNTVSARQLSQQFQSREVTKTYLALVRGGEKSFPERSGEIRDALEFNDGRVSVSDSCNAKFAATDWELIASSPKAPLSLLRLTLHTGLKHQLRVHLAHSLHTPILGDPMYTRSAISDKIARITRVPEDRIFLHASRLCLSRYRKTGSNKHFRLEIAVALPRDFVAICRSVDIPLDKWDLSGGLFVDGEPAGMEITDLDGKWLVPGQHTTH
ncbi:pseudouridine synthase [Phlebopus sp. FC_14]|nr:pseudouridine synthase [Phlebopus sp. FC_14]